MRNAPTRTLFGIFVGFYSQYCESTGKPRWGCKSTFLIDHVDAILEHFPEARFIYLVRDPRDVAASSKRSVFNPYHPYFTARLWQEQQDRGSDLLAQLDPDSILLLRYEELLRDPEGKIRRVCEFLGEDFASGMLQFFESHEARRCSRLSRSWSNTATPIQSNNAGKYRVELSTREILIVEAVTVRGMDRFGYGPVNEPEAIRGVDLDRQRLYYRLADLGLGLRVELGSLLWDKNHWRRWARAVLMAHLKLRARIRRKPRSFTSANGFRKLLD